MEGSFNTFDPLSYYVNNIEKLNKDVVKAFLAKDQQKMKELADMGKGDFDVFICVNSGWHGFVLFMPKGDTDDFPPNMFTEKQLNDPFEVPNLLFCWKCELCFDNPKMRTYLIDFGMVQFKDIQSKVKKAYHIGRYNVGPMGMQLAAMRAAPHHYNVLLNDCVEFSKELCTQLLAYTTNWRDIEESVHEEIKKATATGFSIERLSRNNNSSGYLGNTFLGGIDVSSYMQEKRNIFLGFILLIWPIVVAIVFKYVF